MTHPIGIICGKGSQSHLYSLWIKAVCTIFGWWTADEATVGGAGMLDEESAGFRSLLGSWFGRLLSLPLVSWSATWLGAEAVGEEVMSMASGADVDADVDMVTASAGTGTTRVPIDPSSSSVGGYFCACWRKPSRGYSFRLRRLTR